MPHVADIAAHALASRRRVTMASSGLAWAGGSLASLTLLGWLLDIPALTDFGVKGGRTSIPTAICGMASALSLILLDRVAPARTTASTIGKVLAASVGLFCLFTTLRGLAPGGWSNRIGRPGIEGIAVTTSITFTLLGAAVLLGEAGRVRMASALCLGGLLLSETVLLGYLFNLQAFHSIAQIAAQSLPSALILTLLLWATLLRPVAGSWLHEVFFGASAGRAVRTLLVLAVAVPILLASGTMWLIEGGILHVARALGLLAAAITLFLMVVIFAILAYMQDQERLNARLAAIVESSTDAIIGKTTEGVITTWNRGAQRMFGYAEADTVGATMDLVIPQDRIAEETDILRRIRAGETVEPFETIRRNRKGELFPVSITVSPILTGSGHIIGASSITRDISALVRKDAELRRSNAELEQFAYIASHDLQEPLRMVANYVELLQEAYQGKLDARADKYIGFAVDGARRMQRLVTDLLAYSRVGSEGRPLIPVQLGPIVHDVLAVLEAPAREVGARFDIGPLPCVLGDEIQLGQLFQNLFANAIKFHREGIAPVVRVEASRDGAQWQLAVADNGIGMDPRYQGRIFQMYQRLNPRGQYDGSGIGLSIAKRIVERHEGRIWVQCAEGEGSTFHFTLNACPEEGEP